MTFTNTHSIPHTVHFHGWHDYPADMHGNDIFNHGQVVDPWEEITVEWVAETRGGRGTRHVALRTGIRLRHRHRDPGRRRRTAR